MARKASENKNKPDPQKATKLAWGMLYFVIAIILMAVIFFGFWIWGGTAQKQGPVAVSKSTHIDKIDSDLGDNPDLTSTKMNTASSQEKPAEPPLQGPAAGEVVPPPTRDVTPNFQLSPLHQVAPLTRAEGNPLPPPPKLDPLPQIFRQVMVTGPTTLELTVEKNRIVPVALAYVQQPDISRMCWFVGQQAPCRALGRTALQRFLRRRAVGCDWLEGEDAEDEVGRQNAICYLGAGLKGRKAGETPGNVIDLASWLVRFGWVLPDGNHYSDERQEAIGQKRGVHATETSSNAGGVQTRQSELRDVSKSMKSAADDITSTLTNNSGSDDGTLSLIAPSAPEKPREWTLPPGFE